MQLQRARLCVEPGVVVVRLLRLRRRAVAGKIRRGGRQSDFVKAYSHCRAALRQRGHLRIEPVGQRLQLLRVFQLCLLFLGQGVIIRVTGGLKRLVDRVQRLVVHAVQFRRVRQSVDHRLHIGHGLVLLYSRVLLLFFLFRRLALLLRFRGLILLLHFPVCRVCRFLHGRGRLRRPLRLLCQRRRGQQRQARGQRHETAQDTLLHRSPPVRFLLCPNQSPTDRDLPVGSPPYGSGGAPGQFFSFRRSV